MMVLFNNMCPCRGFPAGVSAFLVLFGLCIAVCNSHSDGPIICPVSAEIGQPFKLQLPEDLPSQLGVFQILNRTSNEPTIFANCSASDEECLPFQLTGLGAVNKINSQNNLTTSWFMTNYTERYWGESTINFQPEGSFDARLSGIGERFEPLLQCIMQSYDLTSDPYCHDPMYVWEDGMYYLVYRCGIKGVYPSPLCSFTYSNDTSGEIREQWFEDASKPNATHTLFDKECYSPAFPISSREPGEYESSVTFHVAPGTIDAVHLAKNISLDPVTVREPNMTCGEFSFDAGTLVLRCIHVSLYPQKFCEVSIRATGFWRSLSSATNQDLGCQTHDPIGCTYVCSLEQTISSYAPGSSVYRFMVRARLVGTTKNVETSIMKTLVISQPEIELVNCTKEILRWGDRARCDCTMTDPGFPAGYPQWVDENDEVVEQIMVGNTARFVHLFNESNLNPNFSCKAMSPMLDSSANLTTLNWLIQYAYGPTSVTIQPLTTTHNLCPNSGSDNIIDVTCSVPITDVNPDSPKAEIELTSGRPLDPVSEETTATHYTYKFKVPADESGLHGFTCIVTNKLFGNRFMATERGHIAVNEPPSSPPTLKLNGGKQLSNNEQLTLTEGEVLRLSCGVTGGFPEVTNVTLKCPSEEVTSIRPDTSLVTVVERAHSGGECSCMAEHASECYEMITKISLVVQFPAEKIKFTVKGDESSEVTVASVSQAELVCEVQGFPRPTIEVKVKNSNAALTSDSTTDQGQYGLSWKHTKQISSCQDPEVFTCVARNSLGSVERSIRVTVTCPPELREATEEVQSFIGSIGQTATANFSIMAYPIPSVFTVTKDDSTETMPEERYTFKVIKEAVSYHSVVTFELFELTSKDEGSYLLTFANGLGNELTANVTVAVRWAEASSMNTKATIISGSIVGFVALCCAIICCVLCFLTKQQLRQKNIKEQQ